MYKFVRFVAALLAVFVATTVAANTMEERLKDLAQAHEAAAQALPDKGVRHLARGYVPSDGNGIYSKAFLRTVPVVEGGKEWRCLSEALYFEARGETVMGQFAVAEVILNRVEDPKFPETICGVVNQGSGRGKYRCQFTYTCDGKLEIISDKRSWANVGKVARLSMQMDDRPLTRGATYYHTDYVSPSWARKFVNTATIGVHLFYKEPDRLSQN